MNKIEANPCTKKYLTDLSINNWLSIIVIRGINLSIFSSNPNHMQKKELDLRITMILKMSENKKKKKGKNIIVKVA